MEKAGSVTQKINMMTYLMKAPPGSEKDSPH